MVTVSKKIFSPLCIILFLLTGLILLLYPAISNYINQKNSSYAMQELFKQLEDEDTATLTLQRQWAESYNTCLRTTQNCPYAYEDILDYANHIMGTLYIPTINVNLPIYHGTEEEVLAKGVGHMPDSAFPIGGIGNHTVLTGHTGLPSARLFTDLDQLAVGDPFYISILNETLAYEVDQIQVVLPTEISSLQPKEDADYCTLVTCTPYGINSHRLLVRGTRIQEEPSSIPDFSKTTVSSTPLWLGLVASVLLVLLFLFLRHRKIKTTQTTAQPCVQLCR